jgi:hypothetical protein
MKELNADLASEHLIKEERKKSLLNQYENPTRMLYKIFGLIWADWGLIFMILYYSLF